MGACMCTGACRRPPYRCAAGDFSRQYDPNYVDRIIANWFLAHRHSTKPKREKKVAIKQLKSRRVDPDELVKEMYFKFPEDMERLKEAETEEYRLGYN